MYKKVIINITPIKYAIKVIFEIIIWYKFMLYNNNTYIFINNWKVLYTKYLLLYSNGGVFDFHQYWQ